MPVSFVMIRVCLPWEKYLFLPLYGNTENPLLANSARPLGQFKKGERAITVLSIENFTKRFKQKNSVLNTSAITTVTKPSMKPRSGATTNHHLATR